MEENKEVKVANSESKTETSNPKKMSYEQLENIAHQLSEQAKQLYTRLQEANMTNMFKRLDYLFKIVENAKAFNEEFVNKCVLEIEDRITIPESDEETDDKSEE